MTDIKYYKKIHKKIEELRAVCKKENLKLTEWELFMLAVDRL